MKELDRFMEGRERERDRELYRERERERDRDRYRDVDISREEEFREFSECLHADRERVFERKYGISRRLGWR